MRLRWLGGALIALLLASGGVWLGSSGPPRPERPVAAEAAPTATLPASSNLPAFADPWAQLAEAQAVAEQARPVLPQAQADMSEADWLRFDQAWCAALAKGHPALREERAMAFSAATILLDEAAAQAPLAARIGHRLLARPDLRSQTLGRGWLTIAGQLPPQTHARHALASRDPLDLAVAALFLIGGSHPDARSVARAWREADPGNAMAWRHAQLADPLPEDEWLQGLAAATTMSSAWQMLLAAALEVQGPQRHAASDLLPLALELHALTERPLWDLELLSDACHQSQSSAMRVGLCAGAAERLWELAKGEPGAARAALEIGLAQDQAKSRWEGRKNFLSAGSSRLLDMDDPAFMQALARRIACRPEPELEARFRQSVQYGRGGPLQQAGSVPGPASTQHQP